MHKIVSPLVQFIPATARYELTLSGSELVALIEALERVGKPWRDLLLAACLQKAIDEAAATERAT